MSRLRHLGSGVTGSAMKKGAADCVVPSCHRYVGDNRRICYACEKLLPEAARMALYQDAPGALENALRIIETHTVNRQGKLPL